MYTCVGFVQGSSRSRPGRSKGAQPQETDVPAPVVLWPLNSQRWYKWAVPVTSFVPSLISPVVSVDVKHHVYLTSFAHASRKVGTPADHIRPTQVFHTRVEAGGRVRFILHPLFFLSLRLIYASQLKLTNVVCRRNFSDWVKGDSESAPPPPPPPRLSVTVCVSVAVCVMAKIVLKQLTIFADGVVWTAWKWSWPVQS